MMKFIRIASLSCLLLVSALTPLRAEATSQMGKVLDIFVNDQGTVFITLDDPGLLAICATSNRYAISILNSEQGKAFYALIVAASALNRNIEINGRDTCNLHSNSEDVRYVRMANQ